MKKINDEISDLVEWLQKLSPETQKYIVIAIAVVGALGGLLGVMGFVIVIMPALTAGIAGLGVVLGLLTGPIGLVIAAIGFLAYAWTTNLGGIRDDVTAFWKDHKETIMSALAYVEEVLKASWLVITTGFSAVWEFIKVAFDIGWGLFKGAVNTAISLFTGDWSGAWENVKKTFGDFWGKIKENFGFVWDEIVKIVENAIKKIGEKLDSMAKKANEALLKVPGFGLANEIGGFFDLSKNAAGGVLQGGFQAFAAGGIVNKPTLGLVGEGSMNEAVVPLPNGRSIPVQFQGGGRAVSFNFGDIYISKEVDGQRFLREMESYLARTMQLERQGSL